MSARDRLILLVKAPVPGNVKTRLRPRLTPADAAVFYRALVEDLAASFRGWDRAALWVAYAPRAPLADAAWTGVSAARTFPQAPGGLGERIEDAFARAFAAGAPRAVVAVTDAPGLTRRYVSSAFSALGRRDAVLGPAADGGFNLVGLRRPLPGLWNGVPWSTGRVLSRVRANLQATGASSRLLAPLADIDGPEELDALARASASRSLRERLPRTTALLRNPPLARRP